MAGKNIQNLLVAKDYYTFYQLVHVYSESVLSLVQGIATCATLISRIIDATPFETFTDSASAQSFKQVFKDFRESAPHTAQKTRQFFWQPSGKEESQADRENLLRKRWQPFNAAAWDKFFKEFIGFLTPQLDALEEMITTLYNLPDFGGRFNERPTAQSARDILKIALKSCRHVRLFLDAEIFDDYIGERTLYQQKHDELLS